MLRGCVGNLLLCKEEGSSPGSAISERRDMGLYEVPLSMCLLGFGMWAMLANCHGIMLVLRAVFNMLVMNASPRGPVCFRYLMFSLSGPCELVFFTLFYCLLDLICGECDVISSYFMCYSVNGSVWLVCCVVEGELFGETIRNMFGRGCYFIVECYRSVYCGWRCSVGYTVYGLPKNVRVVSVIPVCI